MLVVTIPVGQSIQIGEAVVHIQEKSRHAVRLVIDAPKHVAVLRGDAIKKTPVKEQPCADTLQ